VHSLADASITQVSPMSTARCISQDLRVSHLRCLSYLLSKKSVPMLTDIQVLPYGKTHRQEFDWGNLTWFANRAIGNSDDMTVGRCILKPGHTNGRHYHPNCSETLVVIQGRIKHTITGDRETELDEGDTVVIPPNVRHCATNVGQIDAILFIAFSSADRQTVGE
jgi:quercetin dioxygenase-like cupin family protein